MILKLVQRSCKPKQPSSNPTKLDNGLRVWKLKFDGSHCPQAQLPAMKRPDTRDPHMLNAAKSWSTRRHIRERHGETTLGAHVFNVKKKSDVKVSFSNPCLQSWCIHIMAVCPCNCFYFQARSKNPATANIYRSFSTKKWKTYPLAPAHRAHGLD